MLRNWRRFVCVIGLSLTQVNFSVTAQEATSLNDLTEAEYAALKSVTEPSVRGTISFLSSDEMAGRDTPSKELTIASAYVASRLRAAGAEGLGPDGSFYLESTIDTIRTPSTGFTFAVAGADKPPRVALLNGAEKAFAYKGKIVVPSAESPLPSQPIGDDEPSVVAISTSQPEGDGPPITFILRQQAARLKQLGFKALLVATPVESPLWDSAIAGTLEPRLDSGRGGFSLPIILVEAAGFSPEQSVVLQVPEVVRGQAVVRNVAGVIRGSDPALAEEAMVFSAHLDHIGDNAPGEDTIYNGADDDASGVTAVLTLADAFGAMESPTKRSLIFMTFWGEERGLLGSKAFVEQSPWPLENVVANINIEMIGRPETGAENKMWMTGWDKSSLGSLVAQGSRRLGVETFEHPSFSARLYAASDNYSFVQKGVIAHSFSAGSLHQDYHQPSDEWQKLNLPHMTQIIRGLYAGTLPIANGTITPAAAE